MRKVKHLRERVWNREAVFERLFQPRAGFRRAQLWWGIDEREPFPPEVKTAARLCDAAERFNPRQ